MTYTRANAPDDTESTGGWWLGFDAAHFRDLIPCVAAIADVLESHDKLATWRAMFPPDDVYRTVEYMREQCENVAAIARSVADFESSHATHNASNLPAALDTP